MWVNQLRLNSVQTEMIVVDRPQELGGTRIPVIDWIQAPLAAGVSSLSMLLDLQVLYLDL